MNPIIYNLKCLIVGKYNLLVNNRNNKLNCFHHGIREKKRPAASFSGISSFSSLPPLPSLSSSSSSSSSPASSSLLSSSPSKIEKSFLSLSHNLCRKGGNTRCHGRCRCRCRARVQTRAWDATLGDFDEDTGRGRRNRNETNLTNVVSIVLQAQFYK